MTQSAIDAVCAILGDAAFSQRVNDATLDDRIKASANPGQALGRFMAANAGSATATPASVKSSGPKPS